MKRILIAALVGSALLTATVSQASLDLAGLVGSQIVFAGGGNVNVGSTFNITPSLVGDVNLPGGMAEWWITTPGPAVALMGTFAGGPWAYGAITVNGVDQVANVMTPNGGLAIDDGGGFLLTANVNWVQVSTHQFVGGVNAAAVVNISALAYGGLNPALLALVNGVGTGSVDLSFQFNPGMTLSDLTTAAQANGTSYSGSMSAVPEPTTVIAGALLLLPLGASTLRILRRNRMS